MQVYLTAARANILLMVLALLAIGLVAGGIMMFGRWRRKRDRKAAWQRVSAEQDRRWNALKTAD